MRQWREAMRLQLLPDGSRPVARTAATAGQTEVHAALFERARQSLQHLLGTHTQHSAAIQAELQPQLDRLSSLHYKLNQGLIQIAVFGQVSRGKSALLNALFGENIFPTGPLHGVTQWPRSVRWSPAGGVAGARVELELTDTPGLNEVAGESRTEMAKTVARQADLILFVIAGELTPAEVEALEELRTAQKPLLLVLNKIDLYPQLGRQELYARLESPRLQQLISLEEVVGVAAAPAPVQVRVEWPHGKTTYEWEQAPPQVDALQQKLLQVLNREGQLLLALNTLLQAQDIERAIAAKLVELQAPQAEALIWRFVRVKALSVALNPFAVLDLVGGALADLSLIRSLAKLYGLPISRYQAGKLWRRILTSFAGLLLSQLGSELVGGFSKTATALGAGLAGISTYTGAAVAQAAAAGYGAYLVGQATQTYLVQGCTWGAYGPSPLIQQILDHLEPDMILYRIHQELREKGTPSSSISARQP